MSRALIFKAFIGASAVLLSSVPAQAVKPESAPRLVNFPGNGATQLRSSSGLTVYYVDHGPDADGIDDRPIMLRYPNGRTEQIDSFERSADVSWSPGGEWLFVSNRLGSNVADCLLVTPGARGARKRSLTDLIEHSRYSLVAKDLRENDHVYVLCNRWVSSARVEVEVKGHGCRGDPCIARRFDHHLVYDFRRGRLTRSR